MLNNVLMIWVYRADMLLYCSSLSLITPGVERLAPPYTVTAPCLARSAPVLALLLLRPLPNSGEASLGWWCDPYGC